MKAIDQKCQEGEEMEEEIFELEESDYDDQCQRQRSPTIDLQIPSNETTRERQGE